MTSKNLFFNKTWYKNLLKQFWIIGMGLMVAYILLYLCPIYQGGFTESYQYYATYINGSYVVGSLMISAVAVLTSVALLYFLHNRNTSTIIHSLPIKRSELYWSSFLAGMTLIYVPLIITTGLLICFGMTIPSYHRVLTLNHCLNWFLIQSALILFAYGITQICGVITGNIYTHCILGIFFNLLPWVGSQFFTILKSTFTYGLEQPSIRFGDCSTALTYVFSLNKWLSWYSILHLLIFIAVGVVAVFIAYFIYKSVKLEYIGSSVVFEHLRDIIVIIATLVVSSFITFLFISNETSINIMRISFVILGIFVSFIVYSISRMMADSTLYIFNKTTYKKFGIYLLIFAMMCVFFVFDIDNKENKIPEIGDISYITFNSDYSGDQNVKVTDSESIQIIHKIHKDILEAPHNSNDSSHHFNITYHLVDGKKMVRTYNISKKIFKTYIRKDLQSLYKNDAFIDRMFNGYNWIQVSVYNYTDDSEKNDTLISDEDIKGIKYALRKDYKTLSIDEITKAIDHASYTIDITNDGQYYTSFYIDKNFKNTLGFLKMRGYAKKIFK